MSSPFHKDLPPDSPTWSRGPITLGARDEWGDEDGYRNYRIEFWSDLAASSYADCREMLDEILRRNREEQP